jgi:AraC family transcriptional regulator of adaptative response/methylated-DNA-[protein]-cysteine methyltransferase
MVIFPSAAEAEHAGFRACKRCMGTNPGRLAIARALSILQAPAGSSDVRLKALGEQVGMSPSHLQRLFRRQLGVSPSEYTRALRDRHWRRELRGGPSVTRALVEAGFSSTSRAHESSELGATPSAYRRGTPRQEISYALANTPLGRALVASSRRGLCHVSLGGSDEELRHRLSCEYPEAELLPSEGALRETVRQLLSAMRGSEGAVKLPLDVAGTIFQQRVWRALRRIPRGETRSYQQIAQELKAPRAARAVANACARNKVAVLVPCHRAVRKDGGLGGYRWGVQRKARLLAAEKRNSSRARASSKARR